ncbi:hypothetical protein [Rhizobium populisoli]|uniref:hypothetical protein n=1 Tax=Rhizobium populisoli TaxID=2859785 RepID=UPI001FE47BEF|nr:hypothetical protein [Rhizobium populisoli]
MFEDMDVDSSLNSKFRSRCMKRPAITQHDEIGYIVIADVAIEIHRPVNRLASVKIAPTRPPKHHISDADRNFTDGSAFLFKSFREDAQEWRRRPLKK